MKWKFIFMFVAFSCFAVFPNDPQYSVPIDYSKYKQPVSGGCAARFLGTKPDTIFNTAWPLINTEFLLPPDADSTTVQFSLYDTTSSSIRDSFGICPILPACKSMNGKCVEASVSPADMDRLSNYFNNRDAFIPPSHLYLPHTGKGRQYKLADVSICPFLYNPKRKQLKILHGGGITVSFKTIPNFPGLDFPRSEWYENILKPMIVNDTAIFKLYELIPVNSISLDAKRCDIGKRRIVVSGTHLLFPGTVGGVSTRISAYDLSGKMIDRIESNSPRIDLMKTGTFAKSRIYIVEFEPVR